MDRISGHSRVEERVHFGNLRIASLLFADDIILLASSGRDHQCTLGQFAVECEAAGVLLMSEGKMKHELDGWIGAAAAVMRALYRAIGVKWELSRKAKLSIY